jgi:hypothetical protein
LAQSGALLMGSSRLLDKRQVPQGQTLGAIVP